MVEAGAGRRLRGGRGGARRTPACARCRRRGALAALLGGRARRPRHRDLRHQGRRAQVRPGSDRRHWAAGEAGRCLHLGPAIGGGRAAPPDCRLPPEGSQCGVYRRPRRVGARDGDRAGALDVAPAVDRRGDLRRRLRRHRAGHPRDAGAVGRGAEGHDLDRGVGRREPLRRPVGHHDAVLGHRCAGAQLDLAQGAGERSACGGGHGGEPPRRDFAPRPSPGSIRSAGPTGHRPHDVRGDDQVRASGECAARRSLRLPRLPRHRDRRALDGEAGRLGTSRRGARRHHHRSLRPPDGRRVPGHRGSIRRRHPHPHAVCRRLRRTGHGQFRAVRLHARALPRPQPVQAQPAGDPDAHHRRRERAGGTLDRRAPEPDGRSGPVLPARGRGVGARCPGDGVSRSAANAALFRAIEETVRQTGARRIVRAPHHINDPAFSDVLVAAFGAAASVRVSRKRAATSLDG